MIKRLLTAVLVTATVMCMLCSASAAKAQITVVFVVKDEAIDGDGHVSSKAGKMTALDDVIDIATEKGLKMAFFFDSGVKYDSDYVGAVIRLHTAGQYFGVVYSSLEQVKTALIYEKYAVKYASRLVLGDAKTQIPNGIGLCSYTYDVYCATPGQITAVFDGDCDKMTVAIEINDSTAADIVALLNEITDRYTVMTVTQTGRLMQGKAG
ncbi:MAG: hypothetical protein MJ101_02610 [Clostridia bacterium]|nr:hypothetical protein [Clostridia bacterium]